ncbi:MAG: hypothetical protein H7641_13395 [Candidatus Heimdallarchaeota archaeon]|nr:hypothetical protein [Candidatus Heimdallarchaeota archaeon]
MIPIIGVMSPSHDYFYALSFGANWGDNLTPLGDNILVLNIAEQNNRPIKIKTFWKIGFSTTIVQLFLVTIYFTMFSRGTYLVGLIMILVVFATVGILFIFSRYGNEQIKSNISRGINRFRSLIIA